MKKETYNKGIMIFIDFLIFLALLGIDQFIKSIVLKGLKGHPAIVLISNVLELDYLENRGSAFGILQGQKIFILFICFIFMAVMLFLIFKMPNHKKYIPSHILLSIVFAGGVGNMIDRFRFDFVVDYISFVLIHFPVFNFADICIVIAVIGLFILFAFIYKEQDLDFLSFKEKRYKEMK